MGCTEGMAGRVPTQIVPLRGGNIGSVAVYELMTEQTIQTSADGGNWDSFVLIDESFEGLGPGIVDIVGHAECAGPSPYFSYRVVLEYKYLNGGWTADTSTPIIPVTTNSSAYVITATPYSDRTKFGRRIRLVLQAQVGSGGSGMHRGALTLSAAVRFFT